MLTRESRATGGSTRAKRQEQWERSFIAMLGGSKRPITKDRKMSAHAAASILKTESETYPWLMLALLGRDGHAISHRLSNEEIVERIHQAGGVLGQVGLIFFNKNWIVYTRPFLIGEEAKRRLDALGQRLLAFAGSTVLHELEAAASGSPVSALVWTDGHEISLAYDWRESTTSWQGRMVAGIIYLATNEAGKWQPRWKPIDEEFRSMGPEAMQRLRTHLEKIGTAIPRLEK
jgi:hypothetical protein